MSAIHLVYAKSTTSAREGSSVQGLEFAVVVKNLAFDKQVDVHWAGDDDLWHVLPATFSCMTGGNRERWLARTTCRGPSALQRPGNIRFALHYRVAGRDYWDNNRTCNYFLRETDVLLGPGVPFIHIGYTPRLPSGETVQLEVAAAVHWSLRPSRVFVRWSTDGWKTSHQTRCALQRDSCSAAGKNHTCHADNNGASVWAGRIKPRGGFPAEYAFCCETEQGEIWDNNDGINYTACHAGVKILTLNLHCYQEPDQQQKFEEIARAIHKIGIDIVCLQEVGEEWHNGRGDWQSNAAVIILDRLRRYGHQYHLHTDWSHIGFDRYREGSAILSRYRFLKRDARYVSAGTDIHSIHSRKVIMAQIHLPHIGLVNVFSVHLSWLEDGFRPQFEKLRQWADAADAADAAGAVQVAATLLCGDFNAKAGSRGYMLVADGRRYEDQFLRIASPAAFAKVYRGASPGRESCLANDDRIDFIFAKNNSMIKPTSARVLFSGRGYRRVSDHLGYLVEFEAAETASLESESTGGMDATVE